MDVKAPPVPLPVTIVVVFGPGQENGGNTLVMIVACAMEDVTLAVNEPLL